MSISRRDFLKLGVASALVGAASIGWDVLVNGGKPAESESGDEEPPQ